MSEWRDDVEAFANVFEGGRVRYVAAGEVAAPSGHGFIALQADRIAPLDPAGLPSTIEATNVEGRATIRTKDVAQMLRFRALTVREKVQAMENLAELAKQFRRLRVRLGE